MSLYIEYLSAFLRPTSMANYLSAVKTLHKANKINYLHDNQWLIQLQLKGSAKRNPQLIRKATPMTPEMLKKIHDSVDRTTQCGITRWALYSMWFFLMVRKSNILPDSADTFDPVKQLCRKDIQDKEEFLEVSFGWSKTNQAGQRALLLVVPMLDDPLLCPVTAYRRMIRLVPATTEGPAFGLWEGGAFLPYTYSQLQKDLKSDALLAGYTEGGFSSHTFRRGGTSTALDEGASKLIIQKQGDWR
jgi:integrase